MTRFQSSRLTVYGFLGIVLVWAVGSIISAARHDFVHFELEFISLVLVLLLAIALFRPSDAPVLVSNVATDTTRLDHLTELLEELLEAGPDDGDIWRSWLAKANKGGNPMADALEDAEGRDRLDLLGDHILVAMAGVAENLIEKLTDVVNGLPTRVVDFGYEGRHEGFGAAGAELGTPAALEAPSEPLPAPAAAPEPGKRTLGLLETDPLPARGAKKAPAKKAAPIKLGARPAKKAAPVKKAAKKVGSAKAPARV